MAALRGVAAAWAECRRVEAERFLLSFNLCYPVLFFHLFLLHCDSYFVLVCLSLPLRIETSHKPIKMEGIDGKEEQNRIEIKREMTVLVY